jgi:hypothetical protein
MLGTFSLQMLGLYEVNPDIMNIKQGHYVKRTAIMRKLGCYEIGEFCLAIQLSHYELTISLKIRH